MAKKNYKGRKKYSAAEKYRYHSSREASCGKYGLKYGGPRHCYSVGFVDGFKSINNIGGIKGEFGKRSSNAYAIGNKRGKDAAKEYSLRTGRQPSQLRAFVDE